MKPLLAISFMIPRRPTRYGGCSLRPDVLKYGRLQRLLEKCVRRLSRRGHGDCDEPRCSRQEGRSDVRTA